jgi:hypothetical protein
MNYQLDLIYLILIFLFNNLVRPLTQRQNDNLAPKLGKGAHACSRQCGNLNISQPYSLCYNTASISVEDSITQ